MGAQRLPGPNLVSEWMQTILGDTERLPEFKTKTKTDIVRRKKGSGKPKDQGHLLRAGKTRTPS